MHFKHLFIGITMLSVMLFSACHSAHSHNEGKETDEHAEEHKHASDDIEMTAAQIKECGIQVATLRATDFSEVVEVSGQILPATGSEVTITATMEGIVSFTNMSLTEGMEVAKGTSLFVVNAKNLANGNPAAAAQAELQAAKVALERAKKLAADRLITQRELEDAQQRYSTALAATKSLGNASQVRTIGTPMAGIVKNILVKPGDYVAMGQALATVAQTKKLQLRADLPQRYYSVLSNVETANFRPSYGKSESVYSLNELGGRLLSKGRMTDGNSTFIPIIFELNNQGNIVPGSFAEVYLKGRKRSGVLAIPNEAITESQGLHFVFVQVGSDAFRKLEVELGQTDGQRTEILNGLKEGDKVVVKGTINVQLAANATAVPEGHSH